MAESPSKKLISIIIVAAISIGAFALFFNNSSEYQPNSIDQIDSSVEEITSIAENKNLPNSESTVVKNLELVPSDTQLRAAFIDQLHKDFPNPTLHSEAKRMLEDAGYQFDLYTTEEITVDFYKKLPSMNYNFILIRSHGGEDTSYEYPTRLFTGEKYSKEKYTGEQIYGQVGYGFPIYDEDLADLKNNEQDILEEALFTIGTTMVKDTMVGTFPDSVIIVGGCQTARSHDLMEAFMDRGAKNVMGWDATVGAHDNDRAMMMMLDNILVKEMSLNDSVEEVNEKMVPNFKHRNLLKLFNAV